MTITNLDILQRIRDNHALETERFKLIMAVITEIQKNSEAIKAEFAAHVANTKTMLAELAATGATGHAAVLDGIGKDQNDFLVAMKAGAAEIATEIQAVKSKLPGPTPAAPAA